MRLTSTNRDDALERCVGDVDAFLKDYWEQCLLHVRHQGGYFADLLTLEDVGRIMEKHGLRLPYVRIVKNGEEVPAHRFTRRFQLGSVEHADLVDPDRVYAEFDGGASIILQSLHLFWPAMGDFASRLQGLLSHPVRVNAYISPPHSQGLDRHYDTHDVLVLQVHGSKRWEIAASEIRLPTADQPFRRDMKLYWDPPETVDLTDGDCLYVPRGYLHDVRSLGCTSAHLTVGVHAITLADLWRLLFEDLTSVETFRRAIPPGFLRQPEQLAAILPSAGDQLVDWAAAQLGTGELIDRLNQGHANGLPLPTRDHLTQVERLSELTVATRLRRRVAAISGMDTPTLSPTLKVGRRLITFPPHVRDALVFITDVDSFSPEDLPGLKPAEQLDLTRGLVRAGVVQIVEDS